MTAPAARSLADDLADEALATFARSHAKIVETMTRLRALPAHLAAHGVDGTVRAQAAAAHRLFNDAVLAHHDEEERELFPALRHSAGAGDEAGLVGSLVARLEREHRELEGMWDAIEPPLRRLGRGKPATLDAAAVERLVDAYAAHARFEEASVLPLARRILGSGDRAALGLSLAMRRQPMPAYGYV